MTFTVEGRKDKLLERGRFDRHKFVLEFSTKFLIGQEFEDVDAVKTVLATWPKWSKGKTKDIHTYHEKMQVNMELMTIWAGESLGGEFVIGHIIENKE